MSNKKRNKKYRGRHASAPDKPVVKKYSADNTNRLQRWYRDNKQFIIIRASFLGIGTVLAAIVYGLVILIF